MCADVDHADFAIEHIDPIGDNVRFSTLHVHVDEIDVSCNNGSSNCDFSLAVLGNSTGN